MLRKPVALITGASGEIGPGLITRLVFHLAALLSWSGVSCVLCWLQPFRLIFEGALHYVTACGAARMVGGTLTISTTRR